jgi:DNA repair ATPase RecN
MKRSTVILLLTLAGVVLVAGIAIRAASPADQSRPTMTSDDALTALLVEVRGLRAAMEQMAAAGPRVQLALGRVQLQEQRINNLIRRLEELRVSATAAQANYDHVQDVSRAVEDALRAPQADGPPVEQLKEQQASVPRELARAAATLQRARSDQASVEAELVSEQARWTDLNGRMEAIEATLVPR